MNAAILLLALALPPEDAKHTRYLAVENIEKKDRDDYLANVSFVLNSVSNEKKIVKPEFVNAEKTIIKFDIRDYGIEPKNYEKIGTDPYLKIDDKIKVVTKSKNPIMRADFFIVKTMTSPLYYELLGVKKLSDFRKKHNYDPKNSVKAEQSAIVTLSNVTSNSRLIKRIPTISSVIWESRDTSSINYLQDLLSNEYDSIQLLAFNPNGLISYFSADAKGNALDVLNADIAVDQSKSFEPDLRVCIARNCVACHDLGVLPVNDAVRTMLKKNVELKTYKKEIKDKINDLFGSELPIKSDQDKYQLSLMKATGMNSKDFTNKFVSVFKSYYSDLTLDQAANEKGMKKEEFKTFCLESKDARLVGLVVLGKISRNSFEQVLRGK